MIPAVLLWLMRSRIVRRDGAQTHPALPCIHPPLVGQPFQADVRLESLTYYTPTFAVPLGTSLSGTIVRERRRALEGLVG